MILARRVHWLLMVGKAGFVEVEHRLVLGCRMDVVGVDWDGDNP